MVVQRTGWGKSLVYFLATKLLRDRGYGPTLLISPLLPLMRHQIDIASKICIQAFTINSANRQESEAAGTLLGLGFRRMEIIDIEERLSELEGRYD